MGTLKWLDLKTLRQLTLCRQALEVWQMQNLSVLTSVSKLHPIRVFKPHSWYIFYPAFHSRMYFVYSLHSCIILFSYVCNSVTFYPSFGSCFLKCYFPQVKDLTEQFPAATPLALVLKQFLADRTLDQSYSGGLSSYCLVSRKMLLYFGFQMVSLCIFLMLILVLVLVYSN